MAGERMSRKASRGEGGQGNVNKRRKSADDAFATPAPFALGWREGVHLAVGHGFLGMFAAGSRHSLISGGLGYSTLTPLNEAGSQRLARQSVMAGWLIAVPLTPHRLAATTVNAVAI